MKSSRRKSQEKCATEMLPQRSVIKKPYRRRLQWSEQAMIDAIKAVEDGMPVTTAAREHNVPKSSLYNRLSGNVVHGVRPEPQPYLTHNEEMKLAEYVTECASVGHRKTRTEIIMAIAENITCTRKKLRNDKITHGWYHKFVKRQCNQSLHKGDFNDISAELKNAADDELRPTVENEAEEDSGGCTHMLTSLDSSTTHDDVYKKRYEKGYDIYDEPYVRWLVVNHPDDVRNDWMKKLKDSEKDSAMTDQIIEKVTGDVVDVNEERDIAESHSSSEDLFQRRYKEGYDIYDESYVRWLMEHHPGDVKSEWLTKTTTTSKSFEPDQPSEESQLSSKKSQKNSATETLLQRSVMKRPYCRLQWSEQAMIDAMKTVEDGMPVFRLAREHNVPRETLQYKMFGNVVHGDGGVRPGQKPYLTYDEGLKSVGIYPITSGDKLRPTVKNDVEKDSKKDSSTTHDDNTNVYKKRYKKGYDIYDEPNVVSVNQPGNVRNNWMKEPKDSEKDSAMTDQIIEKVTGDVVDVNEESDIAESHSGSEDLFQRWYKEGYDIYDESYVRWLMVHHPGDIKGEWLTNIAATFKSFTLDQPSVKSQLSTQKMSAMETLSQRNVIETPFHKGLQWSQQTMIDTMKEVEDGMPVTTAVREHNLLKSSLHNRISGNVHGVRLGPQPYLTVGKETKLAECITECALAGYEKSREEILTIAENTARDKKKLKKERIALENNLSLHTEDPADNAQQDTITPGAVKHYFDLLNETLQENNLEESPAQVYNVDEMSLESEHRPKNAITLKGQKTIKCHTPGNKKQATLVVCVNAIGQAIPPFVIYDAKTLHPMWMKGGAPGTAYACNPKGCMDTELFKTWLQDHFLKYAVPGRPLLLIVNGHNTHHELPNEFAKEKGVIMVLLPTHASQPLDTCALRKQWNNVAHDFITKTPGRVVWKYNFPPLFRKAWEKAITPSNIYAGFSDAGIYPFNPDNLRPTAENEAEEDSKGDSSTTHDDNTDVYKKRYKEGYDIYDEPYVRWLIVNHPDDVRDDWMKILKDSQKDSAMTDQIIEKVTSDVVDVNEEHDIAESHSASEDLFQRRYKEGYDIYDEPYVRWLMEHHPGDVKSKWLTKTTTTSKSFEPDQPSEESQSSRKQSQKTSATKTLPQKSIIKKPYRRRLQWSQQAMTNALKAVEDGMSVARAAREHNVPRTTLQDRKLGNVVHGVRPGPQPYLTHDEETKLAEYVMCRRKTRAEIMAIAENTARARKKLKKHKITHGWYDRFIKRQYSLSLHKSNPSSIFADFRKAGIYSSNRCDELRLTVENEAEGNSKGDSSTTHDDNTDVYKKRYEEGYDIYDEPYVRWLIVNHPDDVRDDWMEKIKNSEKDSAMTDQIIEKITGDVVDVNEERDIAESHSGSEDLFQRWYKEGCDIYDESYVRWLMEHHPGDLKSEWLTKTTTTSKSFEPDQPSEESQSSRRKSQKTSATETLPQKGVIKTPSRKRKQWSQQAMTDAMKAVEDGMPVARAARQHNVPRTTLQDRMSGKVVHGVRPGPQPYLTHNEETKLAEYVIECASVGHRKTRAEIMAIAEDTARDKKKLRKDKVTHGWYDSFIKRQSNLSLCKKYPSSISADLSLNHSDELRPTVENEAEGNSKGDSSTTHDDNTDVYKKRYEEGYDIYDESYVRWLMEHHPGDVKSEWLTKTTTTSKSFEPDQPSEESQLSRRKSQKNSATETLLQRSVMKRPYRRLQWSEQAMIDAMKAVEDGMPVFKAAREHGVPRATLQYKMFGNVVCGDSGVRPGQKPYLTYDEGIKSVGIYPFTSDDELRPTVENDVERDSKKDFSTTHDNNTDVYKKRYKKGYDIYDEPNAVTVNQSDNVRNNWMKELKHSEKASAMTDQIIEKVTGDVVDINEERDIAESHSGSEDLFQRRYRLRKRPQDLSKTRKCISKKRRKDGSK